MIFVSGTHEVDCVFDQLESPVGMLTVVASSKGIRAVLWPKEREGRVRLPSDVSRSPKNKWILAASQQLDEYFQGKRKKFDLPLDPVGTEFQHKAWQALQTIPYGKTRSYQEQALLLGSASYARAVGAANGRNPLSIIVPCHRVIGKSGKLTGFAGGMKAKEFLLALEGVL